MDVFAALGEPTRRGIVEMLARKGRLSATEISGAFAATPQAISQHLGVLREANLVKVEKQGQRRIYQLHSKGICEFERWAATMMRLWNKRFDAIERLLEEEKIKLQATTK
jgi:DNA-binding transcriptional ArsR family regulator